MDTELLRFANDWASSSPELSMVLRFFYRDAVKNLLPVLILWGLWFAKKGEERTAQREVLISVLFLTVFSILAARAMANTLPHRDRPIHNAESGAVMLDWMPDSAFQGMSAFPSDHAVMFFTLATGLFCVSRVAGAVALLHAGLIVCLPRVAIGAHWPSDILAGALFGIVTIVLFLRPLTVLIRKWRFIPFFETREVIAYPLFFLATYEVARMFKSTRTVLEILLD